MRALETAGMSVEECNQANIGYAPQDRGRGRAFSVLQKENPLRERGWGFVWDERYWEFQRLGKDVMQHTAGNFWSAQQPPWKDMLLDLREVTGWTNGHDHGLLPVVE